MGYSIKQLKETLINKGVKLHPANDQQIKGFMDDNNVSHLPSSYMDFLKAMGNGSDNFLRGESCFFNELSDLKEGAEELLTDDNSPLKLKNSDFIFWMSQGYMFAFFNLNEGDDPPVFFYKELSEQKEFFKIADSFTEFLFKYEQRDKSLFKPLN